MKKLLGRLAWVLIAIAGAYCLATIAITRGEPINSIWLVLAASCTYLVGYRFYGKFIAASVMALNDQRATPAERLRDGHDFEPTNKWILFGHHFAAIAGPGPLVGPTLAAQFGYLPGALWIIVGAVLGGAVQDFVILFCSMRRDGKSLGQMAKDEIGKVGGFTALIAVLMIMIILLAVVALVVVNALKNSPWGTFTIVATMPIAENNISARYSGVSSASRFMYDTATSNASAVALTMITPRNTPKPSTCTMPVIVLMAPWSRTRCHCQNSITPAVTIPAAASAYPTGVAAARRRSNARASTMRTAAPPSAISGAIASQ